MGVPVPIGVRIDLPGATLEWYDEVVATVGFLPGGPVVAYALSHWVTKTDTGIAIVEVWESRDAFKSNARQRTGKITDEIGIPGHPVIEFFEIHNYLPGNATRAAIPAGQSSEVPETDRPVAPEAV
jgi:hypothetical protein